MEEFTGTAYASSRTAEKGCYIAGMKNDGQALRFGQVAELKAGVGTARVGGG